MNMSRVMVLLRRRGQVIVTPGHKWNNEEYYNHTGLMTYANYMFGGGYILSAGARKRPPLARVIPMLCQKCKHQSMQALFGAVT